MDKVEMKWVKVGDDSEPIPFTKVCIYDGVNTFWAYLEKIITHRGGRELVWNIPNLPEKYGECIPTHWIKIEYPTNNSINNINKEK